METDKLIADLVKELKPVKPAPSLLALFVQWLAAFAVYIALLVYCLDVRPDIGLQSQKPLYVAEIAILALLLVASAFSISVLSFPDMHQKRWAAWMPVALLFLLASVIGLEWLGNVPQLPAHNGIECLKCILFSSVIPACFVFYRLSKMASTSPMLAGYVALLSSSSLGCLALRLSEPTDSVSHLVLWHYLPMLGLSILGLFLGKKILKW